MYDLVIMGGGINGVGIARDAAGRGLKVLLCEKDDIAQHTSSASTKLIHGGLRYLEQYEFSLVRKALLEREVLLNIAPHIIWPLRFVLPHAPHLRPAWMIRAGMFLYDNLALRKKLPKSRFVNLQKHVAGQFIKSEFRKGFEYSDAFVYDARLSILNAMDAQERGADIRVQTRVVSATPNRGAWDVVIEPNGEGQQIIQAKVIVNASGPWVTNVLTDALKIASKNVVRHVKGSHIVVPAMFDHKFAYIFQNEDKRVIFAIPFERGFTLVGTTDIEYEDRLDQVKIKLNPISSVIKGKRVVLIDDSIVRGTTCRRIVGLLREAGAKEVHFRVSSPPFLNPCYYGTDIDSRDNLIACNHTIAEISDIIGTDSLGYLPVSELKNLICCGDLCDSCFTGKYPTAVPENTAKDRFEKKLSEKK